MIRAIGYLLSELLWTLVHKVLDPYATWNPDDDRTTPQNIATWVEGHKHPPDEGG